ncbi:sensor histidine kinase [Vibrio intestinalis]|uniref:sensor histidine kinase n=1 Tax=Vibrio intestinalis TaxID=2933291 RepID=UPI0021A62118|nr:histidine kinase [Vibrio intestinalis]
MDNESTQLLRDKVLKGMCFTLGSLSLLLSIHNLSPSEGGNIYLGIAEIVYFFLSVYMLYHMRTKPRKWWFLDLHCFALTTLTVGWAYFNINEGASLFIWSLTLPTVFYLALGKIKGFLWSLACLTIMFYVVFQIAQLGYLTPTFLLINFISTYLCAWGVSHTYESNRERSAEALEKANSYLTKKSSNLITSLQKSELELLRMQTNPHFLFNTLNLISNEITHRPTLAKEVLYDLSDLLRNTIEFAGKTETTIKKEIEIVEHYLAIQSVRFEQRFTYEIDVERHSANQSIPPMLTLTLVENVIKHVVSKSNNPIELHIKSEFNTPQLLIVVENTALSQDIEFRYGTGLSSIVKTLELEYNNASFDIKNENQRTIATIRINLESNRGLNA